MTEIPTPQLVTITFVVTDPDPEDEGFGMSPLVRKLIDGIDGLISSGGPNIECVSSQIGRLPTRTSDRCAKCGSWTTDGEANEEIYSQYKALNMGAIYNGKLLCDLCLPEDHPLHF